MTRILSLVLLLAASICASACAAAPTPTATPTVPPSPTAEAKPTAATQPTPDATAGPTPTRIPALIQATLPNLAERKYTAGDLQITRVLTETDAFTTSLVSYTSDGLKVTGLLNVPKGTGKFPAVVLVHGYVSPEQYTRGLDAQAPALELTQKGYVTLVPDLRGYEESDHGLNLFLAGWIADVINAGNALKKLPEVDADHVGLWGHSMGGGIATRVMVVSDMYDAVVLYAPISADIDDMFMDPFGGEPAGVTQELVEGIITSLDDAGYRSAISPVHYLDRVQAPVSIHVGTADTVTPKEWSRAIRDGLERAAKNVEYFEYPDGGHSLRGDALVQFYVRVQEFFDKYLK